MLLSLNSTYRSPVPYIGFHQPLSEERAWLQGSLLTRSLSGFASETGRICLELWTLPQKQGESALGFGLSRNAMSNQGRA